MIKGGELKSLETRLASELPAFAVKERLMVMTPVYSLVRGLNFEGSQSDDVSFYVTMFAMPLCPPSDHLYFNFGDRIRHSGGGDRWNIQSPSVLTEIIDSIRKRALPFFSKLQSLSNFVEMAETYPVTVRTLEAIGYAQARLGEVSQALDTFERLAQRVNSNVAWQRDVAERARDFEVVLVESLDTAQEQLIKWEEETVRNLHLEKFRQSA